jgi:hypothetical protein
LYPALYKENKKFVITGGLKSGSKHSAKKNAPGMEHLKI